ncbi:hypothetical protein [Klebsiella pneumoniae]|uniref:hypothetical protein n=1 Tax=Klebsiella pneumoniae TaxID=573 RepID=UPI002D7ACAF1|nr:hypothetical protein [Klebsiella pneumoniae]MEA4416273.1 hypothetical protein [Klebsiella pneumoniae]MEB8242265.1 hypothetical protein [Klebsiella pneumoniae]
MTEEKVMFSRIFKTLEFREQFLDGRIFMNPLGFFKSYDEEVKGNISDSHEGAYKVSDAKFLKMTINNNLIESANIIGPVVFSHKWTECVNIVCLTIIKPIRIRWNNNPYDTSGIQTTCHYCLQEGAELLGDFGLIITDPYEFLKRLKVALDLKYSSKEINDYKAKPVTYYSDKNVYINLNEFDFGAVFYKNDKYKHQNEFRIAVDRLMVEQEPYVLEIGSIRDICIALDARDKTQIEKIYYL